MKVYKVVIGLEVHCELETKSKNFSGAPNEFVEAHNINVATVDLGLPGILPVANKEAVRKALFTAMALHCKNPDEVIFDRKNYYYPDLPKGYQITQVTKPMGVKGYLDILVNGKMKRVDIHQLHLEEDTAKIEHLMEESLINYNRAGVPLLELVTEPVFHSKEEVLAFLEYIRKIYQYTDISDADVKRGQVRCDVNISVALENEPLGTKVEIKGVNSFSNILLVIDAEIARQKELIENGKKEEIK